MADPRVAAVNRLTGYVVADRAAFLAGRFYAIVTPERVVRGVYVAGVPATLPAGTSVGDLILKVHEASRNG